MASPVLESPAPIADPAASASPFSQAAAPTPRTESPFSQPTDHQQADQAALDSMLAEAGKLMGDPQAPPAPTTTKEPAAKTAPQAPPPAKLPPPIKAAPAQPSSSDAVTPDEAASTTDTPTLTEEDLQKIPFEKWPRDAKSWKENRDLAKQRQVNHLKSELTRLKDLAKTGGPEGAAIIEERDALREELRAIAIEKDPSFKAKYDTAFSSVRSTLESILGKDDVDKALTIFDQNPSLKRTEALEKFSEDLSPIKQSALTSALLEHDRTSRSRTAEITEARKNWDKLQYESRTSAEQADRNRVQTFKKALDSTVKEWTDPKTGYAFMSRTGDAAKDAHIDEMVGLADTILTGTNSPDEMARAAMYAALTPRLFTVLGERDTTIAALQAELASLKSASPSLRSGEFLSQPGQSGTEENLSYGDAIARAAQQAGLPLR